MAVGDRIFLAYRDDVDLLSEILLGNILNESNYKTVMKKWFAANGADLKTDYIDLCNQWYSITRKGWTGGTKFAQPDVSSVPTGTAVGDNRGLTCTPSTETVKGQDDYASVPLFAVVDCNVELDSTTGKPKITAIDGVAGNFERYNPTKIVCAMQMTPFIKIEETATDYTYWYSDEWMKDGYNPWPDAIDLDGTVRQFVVHTKYLFGDNWSSCSGQKVHTWDISHNAQITGIRTKWGNRYCGKTTSDDAWVKWQTYIKYKSLSPETVGYSGCVSYYTNTTHPAAAETGVKRFLMPANSTAFVVGSTVCIGSATYGSKATMCDVVDRAVITSSEQVTVDETTYTAFNLDIETAVDITTDLFVSAWMWDTGSLDNILGNDGAKVLNNSKYNYKIQGIECVNGCYEVLGDSILRYDEIEGSFYCTPYVCRDATKISTAITDDYTKAGYHAPVSPEASAWQYIRKLGIDADLPECMFPQDAGGANSGSTTFTRDALYNEHVTSADSREWLSVGGLSSGGDAGLSFVRAVNGLTTSGWYVGGRLSVTGNRGELPA